MARILIIVMIALAISVICTILESNLPQCIFSRDSIMCVELSKMRGN